MSNLPQAQAAFDAIKAAIDSACNEKKAAIAFLTAENQGLPQVEDNTDVMVLAYNFERIWECGLKLHLSFDPTTQVGLSRSDPTSTSSL